MEETNVKSRGNTGKIAGAVGIITNALLACGKLIVGILSASVSIIADAVNNFTDGISSIVTLIGFKLASKPADEDHPFGHARFEYIASLIVSVIILFVGFELGKGSVEKIISPTVVNFTLVTAIVLGVSILIKVALAIFNGILAKRINSSALKATSADSRNDAIITTAVLIASIIEYYTGFAIDGYVGIAVAVFILISGVFLVKETSSVILGAKNDDRLKNIILEKIKEYPIVVGYHDLMIHDYGPGISFCSIHFEVDKNLDPLYVHELIDKFEREFIEYGTQLTVHYDPVVLDSEELNSLKHAVSHKLIEIDNRLSLHDFRLIPCDGFSKVFFDIPLPEDLAGREAEIKNEVETALNGVSDTTYEAIITFDSYSFN